MYIYIHIKPKKKKSNSHNSRAYTLVRCIIFIYLFNIERCRLLPRDNSKIIKRPVFIHKMQGMVRRRRNQTADWFTMGREEDLDSCSSSSIGKNSDVSGGSSEEEDDTEVPSSYKGPLDTMHDLEEVLPIR